MELLLNLLAGTLGVLLQVCVKVGALKKKFKAANIEFVFGKYLRDDWPQIAGSFLSFDIFALILPEILKIKPELIDLTRICFAFIGYTGSSAFMFFSPTGKKILSIIQENSNIANTLTDQTPPNQAPPVQDEPPENK